MIYVFAPLQRHATAWARQQGLRPRDVRPFGRQSRSFFGTVFRPTDRVVVLGELDRQWEAMIRRTLGKIPDSAPEVERLPLDVLPVCSR